MSAVTKRKRGPLDRLVHLRVRDLQVNEGLFGRSFLLGVLVSAVPVHREGHRLT